MSSNKGVIINVYVESSNLRSHHWKYDPIKKINQNASSSKRHVCQTRGYDRRAQLLAYAQELRHANAQEVGWDSKAKQKKRRWPPSMQKMGLLFSRFRGTNRKWRYEAIVTDDYSDGEGSCCQERMKSRKTKANDRRNSCFCKKLKSFLKEISTVWLCRK